MLTHEAMGAWALAVSWLTALLVALDLGIEFRRLRELSHSLRYELVEAVIGTANFASHEIEQRVRRLDSKQPTLGFWDRSHRSHLHGGSVVLPSGDHVDVVAAPGAEVWTSLEAKRASAELSDAEFRTLFDQARGKGALRTIETHVSKGCSVWLAGARTGARLQARLVATYDPRIWIRSQKSRIALVWILDLVWVALGTVLALSAPHFGAVSTTGAVVLLAHFLLITPAAVSVRERCRTPAFAFLRGETSRPAQAASPGQHSEVTST